MSQSIYSGEKAAEYALRYALVPNPSYQYFSSHGDGGGDCTNFISQCLHAGGAAMAFGTSSPWWYNNMGTSQTDDDKHSISWAVANSLYWALRTRCGEKIPGIKAQEVDDLGLLRIGDIIQYENIGGAIYHSAIITSFWFGLPLITQHTYNAANISYIKSAAYKMHFMKIIVD